MRPVIAPARRRLALAIFVCLAAALPVTGCRGDAVAEPDVTVACEVRPTPAVVGPSVVMITMTDAQARPIAGATVAVEGNMSHPGMVPEFADAREVEPGRYQADLEFTMAGDWILSVTARLPDGREVRRRIDVRGVAKQS